MASSWPEPLAAQLCKCHRPQTTGTGSQGGSNTSTAFGMSLVAKNRDSKHVHNCDRSLEERGSQPTHTELICSAATSSRELCVPRVEDRSIPLVTNRTSVTPPRKQPVPAVRRKVPEIRQPAHFSLNLFSGKHRDLRSTGGSCQRILGAEAAEKLVLFCCSFVTLWPITTCTPPLLSGQRCTVHPWLYRLVTCSCTALVHLHAAVLASADRI